MAIVVPRTEPTGESLDRLLRGHAAVQPDAPAVTDPPDLADVSGTEPGTWAWQRLDTEVDRVAAVLLAHGIRRGDTVAAQLPDGTRLVQTVLACWRIGAAAMPLTPGLRDRSLTYRSLRAGARTIVAATRIGRQRPAATAAALPCFRTVLAWGPEVPCHAVDLAATSADPAEPDGYLAHVRVRPEDRAAVLWSGCEHQRAFSHREIADSPGYLVPWLHAGGHLRITGTGRTPPL